MMAATAAGCSLLCVAIHLKYVFVFVFSFGLWKEGEMMYAWMWM